MTNPTLTNQGAAWLVESLLREIRVARYEGARNALLELAAFTKAKKLPFTTLTEGDILRYTEDLYPPLPDASEPPAA